MTDLKDLERRLGEASGRQKSTGEMLDKLRRLGFIKRKGYDLAPPFGGRQRLRLVRTIQHTGGE